MRSVLYLIFTLAFSPLLAQSIDPSVWNVAKFRAIGPAGMSGRVTSIAVVHKDPTIIYVGTASGGLWKSANGGIAWQPIFDDQPLQSIGAVAVSQSNPAIVWAGTGEGNPRNSHNAGNGIFKSLDGGKSWTKMGLEATKTIHRILVHPTNPNVVFVAAMGSPWGPSADRGVYKTTDGGISWNKILSDNNTTGCAELVMDPSNPDKLFAALWDYERKPWTFRSGGSGSALLMSVDGGATWKKITAKEGLPEGTLGRIGLAVSPANPDRVYAIVESKTLDFFRSNDGGYKWEKVSSSSLMGNRPFYYNEIYADPKNENIIYSLWSQVSKSEDGGKTWNVLLDWGHVHPDHHAFYIHPDNPKWMINGNDGGLNFSYDGGKNWRYVSNLPVGQFYHVSVDNCVPYHIYGGLQDNGSWQGKAFSFVNGGLNNADWQELLFGDGFDVVPKPGSCTEGYAMWQGGNIYKYNTETAVTQAIKPVHPQGVRLRYNWNAALAVDETQPNTLYFGSQFLHKSVNDGASWSIISPDLTTNDTSKLHQEKSGGLTIDATNAENHCTIISIGISKADNQVIWVGTDDGNLQLTKDGGKQWNQLSDGLTGLPKGSWIPYIWVSPTHAGEAWVIANNYRRNDWNPYVYKTTNFGKTWERLADASKVTGHCLSVLPDTKNPNLVFLGTDHGLWISTNGGKNWEKMKNGIPSAPVNDIKIQETEDDLVVGTFGRSIFVLDHLELLRSAASLPQMKEGIKILSTQHGYQATYMQPAGARFGADAEFVAANKPMGTPIAYRVIGNKNAQGKWDPIEIKGEIYQANGTKVRTHTFKADSSGIFIIHWRMIADGLRFPTHATIKKDADLPEGLPVMPGKYKCVLKYGKFSDSAWVEVLSDPRYPFNTAGYQTKQLLYNRLKSTVSQSFKSFEALKAAEEALEFALEKQTYASDSAVNRLKKAATGLKDSLSQLKALYQLPKDFKGYEDYTVRLNDLLYEAWGYLESLTVPGQNAEDALANAENRANAVHARVNAFFANQWAGFVKATEQEKPKPVTVPEKF